MSIFFDICNKNGTKIGEHSDVSQEAASKFVAERIESKVFPKGTKARPIPLCERFRADGKVCEDIAIAVSCGDYVCKAHHALDLIAAQQYGQSKQEQEQKRYFKKFYGE